MRLVFLGPPGAGKGTVAELLKERLRVAHVSSGDLLRESAKTGDSVGKKVRRFIEEGVLVPDALVTGLVLRYLEGLGASGDFVLDGFPRTVEQARTLDETLAGHSHKPVDRAIDFKISHSLVVTRLAGRRVCSACGANYHLVSSPPARQGLCDRCGAPVTERSDDRPETIVKRLAVYRDEMHPLLDFYRGQGKLRALSGETGIEEEYRSLTELLRAEGLVSAAGR